MKQIVAGLALVVAILLACSVSWAGPNWYYRVQNAHDPTTPKVAVEMHFDNLFACRDWYGDTVIHGGMGSSPNQSIEPDADCTSSTAAQPTFQHWVWFELPLPTCLDDPGNCPTPTPWTLTGPVKHSYGVSSYAACKTAKDNFSGDVAPKVGASCTFEGAAHECAPSGAFCSPAHD